MKKIFLFAAAIVASATLSAEVSFDVCNLDSAKFASVAGELATKTYTTDKVAAGTVLHNGTEMKVTLPFAQQLQWVSAAQPNGAHKKVVFGAADFQINMNEGFQGKDNPKDADGGNPCNTLTAPTQGACYQVEAKADGWVVVLHKATSNKQYFVFENGSPLGYKFGMMTYKDSTENLLGNGLLQYILTGDAEYNYLDTTILYENTGFKKIAFVEDYVNDTTTSGVAWEGYKKSGVSAVAFLAYEGCKYLVGAAGSKMTCAGIVFVKGLNGTLSVKALGETITEEGKDPVTYNDVELVQIEGVGEQAIDNVDAAQKAQKVVRDGQVLIIKNGVAYTVLGTVAK